MEKIFLAKIKNTNDRDCVKYIKFSGFECEHYFGGLHIEGACFYGFDKEFRKVAESDFENLETILTKEEMLKIFELNDKLKALGYDIKRDSKEYNEGIKIMEEYFDTIGKKLLSEENENLYQKVITDEKEYIKKKYDLCDSEVNEIFDNYYGGYQDRAIVGCVFSGFDEMVEEEKLNFGYENIPYFNDEEFGNDLLNDDSYYELESGKIVYYCY